MNGTGCFQVAAVVEASKRPFPSEWKNRSFWWDNKWNIPSQWKFRIPED